MVLNGTASLRHLIHTNDFLGFQYVDGILGCRKRSVDMERPDGNASAGKTYETGVLGGNRLFGG